ncbi:long-chain fatty acid--CoA ligase [Rhodococcus sp. WS3]|uniref:AMP-binding protein n=1 Tax=Rhodococcus sp. WS3 TaxID=2486271 RepID=UPI001142F188|nr:AMP-binding protein [Rhodococcus sp. WS3]ROZ45654.1 long-chain fatty acid--CoA ligase [Rhodococcus sp. WS3]
MNTADPWLGVAETIDDSVRRYRRERPDAVAFVGLGRELTWAQLDDAADRAASDLARRGIGVGSRVGWLGSNDIGFPILLLAAWRRRAALAGLNWRLTADELRRTIENVELDLVIADVALGELARSFQADESRILVLGPRTEIPWSSSSVADDATLIPEPDDVALFWFTSGSTGLPKAAAIGRARNELAQYERTSCEMTTETTALVVPPVFHVAGSCWVQYGLSRGAKVVFTSDSTPQGLLTALEGNNVTHALMVPTLIQMVLQSMNDETAAKLSLEHIGYGTSPIPEKILRAALEVFKCRFSQIYGLTEAGGVVAQLEPADHELEGPHPTRYLATGRPFAGNQIEIWDLFSGVPVPAGVEGQIMIKSPSVMLGYWQGDGLTADPISPDQWVATGDMGYLNDEGYLYVVGRADDMIITGGENVQPAEVEAVLLEMPGVVECAVFGLPDEVWGQRVSAAVVVSESMDPEEVRLYCRERLAHFKCPKDIRILDELPRNATGKILRGRLKQVSV